jgi:hypothetical protein
MLRTCIEYDRYRLGVWEVYSSRTFRYPRDYEREPYINGEIVRTANDLAKLTGFRIPMRVRMLHDDGSDSIVWGLDKYSPVW